MSSKDERTPGVFLKWMVGNLVGWTVTSALIVFLPTVLPAPGPVLTGLVLAAPVGIAQWLVLRRLIGLTPLWVVTIPVGWLLSYLIFAALPESLWRVVDDEATTTLAAMFAVVGAATGLPQWLILRREFARAGLWILGSAVGVGLGFALVLATDLVHQSEFVAYSAVSLVYGAATGSILSQRLKYRDPARAGQPGGA
jgi:hypothetical protein